jgi:hypothetical protein
MGSVMTVRAHPAVQAFLSDQCVDGSDEFSMLTWLLTEALMVALNRVDKDHKNTVVVWKEAA